jgi:transcriptional regulator with XRE-family HTH domain
MTRLLIQKLIDDKMKEGKSRTQIAKEAGVTKTALHTYYHNSAKPKGKSLVALANYFNYTFDELMEPVDENKIIHDHRKDDITRLVLEKLQDQSETVKSKVLAYLVEMIEGGQKSGDQ